jgi:hypothetical protein
MASRILAQKPEATFQSGDFRAQVFDLHNYEP